MIYCKYYIWNYENISGANNAQNSYVIKQPDGEAAVMLKIWEMDSSPSLPSPPCPLWPGIVALDRVLCMNQIEMFDI